MTKCLIIKTSAFGDIVQAYPVVHYLRRTCPHLHLTWVVESKCAELITRHPAVDRALLLNTKKKQLSSFIKTIKELRDTHYDFILDLQGNIKSAIITSIAKGASKIGFARGYVAEWPNTWAMHRHALPPHGQNIRDDYLFLAQTAISLPLQESDKTVTFLRTDEKEREANARLVGENTLNTLLLFAGSAWKNKQLDPETLFLFLSQAERELDIHWLLGWGSPEEKVLAEQLQSRLLQTKVIERLSLAQLQHLMTLTLGTVSCDSLPLHLAAAAGVPTYSFFGPSKSSKYAPTGHLHDTLQGPCPYGREFHKRCPLLRSCTTGLCLKGIDPFKLYCHFKKWLEHRQS